MAEAKSQPTKQQPTTKKGSRIPQSFMPRVSLKEAVAVANALRDDFAGSDATPIDLAQSLSRSPSSSAWQFLTGAAVAYGLTTGAYNAATISLTTRGQMLTMPTDEGEDSKALFEAAMAPEVPKAFYEKYDRNKFPSEVIAKNVLTQLGVQRDRVDEALKIIIDNGELVGIFKDVSGNRYVQLHRSGAITPSAQESQDEEGDNDAEAAADSSVDVAPVAPALPATQENKRPNAIFLGHGKNKRPLEQLIKILDEYGIPHKEAMVEANAGRPIPTKVAETMRECGAAILIFTADEQFTDMDDKEVWRPSENVVHELGASSVLYDNRIIIFKEDKVSLASNYSGIGYIPFEHDKLSEKGIDLFRELVSFKIVNITIGG